MRPPLLAFWKRLLITVFAMLATSFVAGLLWHHLLGFASELPSYVAGLIGGMAALPTWEILKRLSPTKQPDISGRPPP
jgi:uncharacterized membrane protein YccC